MKILNLYAGIGGNRKLWGDEHEVTAIEWNKQIAKIYQDFFPKDKVIVTDAIDYLERNFHKFDFIWASPPCLTHTKMNIINAGVRYNQKNMTLKVPDLRLYSIILFLKHIFRGNWVVENVVSYYPPLVKPTKLLYRHCFWSNFPIHNKELYISSFYNMNTHKNDKAKELCEYHGFNYDELKSKDFKGMTMKKALKNCVHPKLGLHMFRCAFKEKQQTIK